ncbi:cupin domain-containing protein [Nonomuraea sp. NBC_00507]|uniref:cupin domain-containing protein n=1 Tax=Nonomuraea sp. NBC_00507 TaxID=2976002 RepID=UPI002E196AF1
MKIESPAAVSIPQVIRTLPGPFQQRELARANDAVVRVAQLHGEFPWHDHDEDELFLCWDGTFRIEIEGRDPVTMVAGDVFVVPKGLRHRPVADEPAHVLLVEPAETRQYGS